MAVAHLRLGKISITLHDDEFGNGFQVGYLHFKKDFQNREISDTLINEVFMQNMIDVHHVGRCNAGYLTGWLMALLEGQPEHPLPTMLLHVPLFSYLPRADGGASTDA